MKLTRANYARRALKFTAPMAIIIKRLLMDRKRRKQKIRYKKKKGTLPSLSLTQRGLVVNVGISTDNNLHGREGGMDKQNKKLENSGHTLDSFVELSFSLNFRKPIDLSTSEPDV